MLYYHTGERGRKDHQDTVLRQDHERLQGQDPKEDVGRGHKGCQKIVCRTVKEVIPCYRGLAGQSFHKYLQHTHLQTLSPNISST